jgi:hypothetical protein
MADEYLLRQRQRPLEGVPRPPYPVGEALVHFPDKIEFFAHLSLEKMVQPP